MTRWPPTPATNNVAGNMAYTAITDLRMSLGHTPRSRITESWGPSVLWMVEAYTPTVVCERPHVPTSSPYSILSSILISANYIQKTDISLLFYYAFP